MSYKYLLRTPVKLGLRSRCWSSQKTNGVGGSYSHASVESDGLGGKMTAQQAVN